jgi:hypothetical protein
MAKHAYIVLIAYVMLTMRLPAQFRPVSPGQLGERIVAIVPVVNDVARRQNRPLFTDMEGVTSFKAILSDDGRWALVEIVAKTRKALAPAFNNPAFSQAVAGRAGLPVDVTPRIVYRDSGQIDDILADFQKLRRGFRPEQFGVGGR